jgi:hypothetical protein
MAFIRQLRQAIDKLMEENRRKRLDAEENAKLEELFKQQHREQQRIQAERKRREQEPEAPAEPAAPVKVESDFVTLDVIGGGHVTCNRADFAKIRTYAPFFWHIAANGSMHPATLYFVDGAKVLMPLQNIAPSVRSSGTALSAADTEPFTTPREYRSVQAQRMQCRNEQRRNSKI